MNRTLLASLVCPYCAGSFREERLSLVDGEDVRFGLISCRCFTFPVVDGILMLSLSKSYGGAEEALQPYVALQVAAIEYLRQDDISGLMEWIGRHLPLVAELIRGTPSQYLDFFARVEQILAEEVRRYLDEVSRYEVLGVAEKKASLLRRGLRKLRGRQRTDVSDSLYGYYSSRFFAPRLNSLAIQLGTLPLERRLLSLCSGHGIFENIAAADGRATEIVSVDGQFLNLLIARRYTYPAGQFICHDLQYPLPFYEGAFDGVFASTCLPEIPVQQSFVREAIRVSASTGWVLFDSIWGLEMGVKRVDKTRHYRFCENFFSELGDYLPFFEHCAGAEREVGVDVAGMPAKYLNGPTWLFGSMRDEALARRNGADMSVLVTTRGRFRGFTKPHRPWVTADRLAITPVYSVSDQGKRIYGVRRPRFSTLKRFYFVPVDFPGFPEALEIDLADVNNPAWLLDQYCHGLLTLLPAAFSRDTPTLAQRRDAAVSHGG